MNTLEAQLERQIEIEQEILSQLAVRPSDREILDNLAKLYSGTSFSADARMVAMSICQTLERFADMCHDESSNAA